ncbi:outer membrane beta-barrel protein [Fontisphaera persica]|uniref:outer membrane beta-barrel protein n=1 Tax=Fontisphaera persica TaxID=2974023 RepID=UPI0024C0AC54|nr:outer membrane beta-barrel protein [Fontisphaera persica]WCJ61159.1 outer membrane beta-barrel protein [Fontisphaera persica]
MKKLFATAGMAALGAASMNAATPPTLLPQETAKPWSVSASVRGFYDDNYATLRSGLRRDSFGLEVSPSVRGHIIKEMTQLYASYKFGMRYYEDRINNELDYSHLANVMLNHDFSERFRMTLYDDFVVAQEPSLLNPAQPVQTLRVRGSNLRNTAGADFRARLTESVAFEPGYSFTVYDYREKGNGSYSAILDRHEHLAKVGVRWINMLERTDGLLGYQYMYTGHTSKDTLDPTGAVYLSPKLRDTRSHYYFAGVDYSASERLTLSARAGAMTVTYRNNQSNRTSPYFDVSASYRFAEASTIQLGYKLQRMTTDLIGYTGMAPLNLTVDQLAHFFYARVSHTISRLTLNAGAQYQYGTFRGGAVNSQDEGYLSVDLGASYKINPFLAAEAGYSFDWLKDYGWPAGTERDFHRNFVYIGLKATY